MSDWVDRMNNNTGGRRVRHAAITNSLRQTGAAIFLCATTALVSLPTDAAAQSYRFNTVSIEGNQRIEAGTILSYAGIARGKTVSAAELNAAYQRIVASGLFESVEIEPRGGKLVIVVREFPTINKISIEGNRRLKDEALEAMIQSKSRLVFSPTVAERDAASIAEAYNQAGRLSATVTPRIIRRSDNRVDLVFEIFEGGITEIERLSFVGNEKYSDGRLRRVLQTKQAGLLRTLIKRDTLVEDRIEFDKQVLRDFYLSRGYVDFRITGVNAELTRERDGYYLTMNVQEGQQFRFGEISASSELADVDSDEFMAALKVKPGVIYSPTIVENSIARLERLANKKGLNFVRVEPRITRNDRDLTLDVEFVLSRGPRVFVERIDIEGNTTTMDQVIRRQFKIVEGDPFNPREIRESAERIRALGFFSASDVKAREGSSPDRVIVGVNVEETTTGSLSFGGTYSTNGGIGLVVSFKEENFLGRGQKIGLSFSGADTNRVYGLRFSEPAFLGRDLQFDFDLSYRETQSDFSSYDSTVGRFSPGFTFPVSDNGRLGLFYKAERLDMQDGGDVYGGIIGSEIAQGVLWSSGIGYNFSYDTRRTGLNPNAGVLFQFGQEFTGLGGDSEYVKTTAKAVAQTKVMNEEITLRATVEAGVLSMNSGSSRAVDRFQIGNGIMRGFEPDGIGPREIDGVTGSNDALGGDMFAVARFEAEFPLGLPEEYGISGGVFYDVGSLWGLGDTSTASGTVLYEGFNARHVLGLSLFWTTPVGPLRFNWTKALKKEDEDLEQTFNLTISTEF
ncbi:Beta-barrel assembly machine subunit BamA [Thalassovita taeanensis]|uniref:Outer membrane protein assembly factor BamA n=2 Tax=Thalassovita taeanensis TaxID=657014 RepID=A0A1H8ZHW8_9RHOB|nr:Beta-barrel assembly machine subunit BamA [Thalassovita taeanensis]